MSGRTALLTAGARGMLRKIFMFCFSLIPLIMIILTLMGTSAFNSAVKKLDKESGVYFNHPEIHKLKVFSNFSGYISLKRIKGN